MNKLRDLAIVVGVDRSDQSLAAVDVGIAEARARQLPLVLLSAHPTTERTGPRTTLTALLRRVCTSWPELPATARNVTGDPAETLLAASRSAALMIVGRRHPDPDQPISPYPTHSVSAQVAAHSYCPTVVVPSEVAAGPDAPVLLGLGMSGADDPAIGFAFEEAANRRVRLLALHVWSGIPASAVGTISPFAYDLNEARHAADDTLHEVLEPWADKYPMVQVERMALYDVNPAQTLVDASQLAGLLVVGSHRPHLHGSQLLGSTTRTLIAHAHCPVAVVRPSHRG